MLSTQVRGLSRVPRAPRGEPRALRRRGGLRRGPAGADWIALFARRGVENLLFLHWLNFVSAFLKIWGPFCTDPWNSDYVSSKFRRKIVTFMSNLRELEWIKFWIDSFFGEIVTTLLLEFWAWYGFAWQKIYNFRKGEDTIFIGDRLKFCCIDPGDFDLLKFWIWIFGFLVRD